MSTTRFADQRTISAWFDATYERLGVRYLRPPKAYLVFPELLGIGPRDTLLDVACGPGMLLAAASEATRRLHGCDLSAVAVRQAQDRVPGAQVVVANAEALPYRAGAFDRVTCLGSLERMLDRPRALGEMMRVAAPRARFCFLVRNSEARSWSLRDRAAARLPSKGHPDADTIDNWGRLFESVGLRVLQILPDQYPLLRRRQWSTLFLRKVDFRKSVTSREPLDRANEFIFVLEKGP